MKRATPVLFSSLLLAALAGCGGGNSSTSANASNNGGNLNGGGSPLPAGTELLYVGDNAGIVHGFGVDPNSGSLTPLSPVPVTNGAAAGDVGLAADLGGMVLYATSAGVGGPNVDSFLVDQHTGTLSPNPGQALSVSPRKLTNAPGGGSAPSACCVYVIPESSSNAAQLFQFTIDKFSGALTEKDAAITLPCVPDDVTSDPSGFWMGTTCEGAIGGQIIGLGRDPSTGAVGTPVSVPSGGDSPQAIRVTPDGKFVVVANQGSNTLSVFSLDSSTGALVAVPGWPFASGQQPGPIAIDPPLLAGAAVAAKFVFVGNTGGNSLSVYTMDAGGSLMPVPGTPVSLGANAQPSSIAVDPGGKFVYVSIAPQEVAGFAFDSSTGALTPIGGSPFPVGAVTRDMVFVP